MNFKPDIEAIANRIILQGDISRAIQEPSSKLNEAFVLRRISEQHQSILLEANEAIKAYEAAQREKQSADFEISVDLLDPWYMGVFGLLLILLLAAIVTYFLPSLFGLAVGAAMRDWLLAAAHLGYQQVISLAVVALFVFSAFRTIVWLTSTRPQRVLELRVQLDIATLANREIATLAAAQDAVEASVLHHIRQCINLASDDFFQDTLVLEDDRKGDRSANRETAFASLSETWNPLNEIPTAVRERVLRLIRTLPGASIGISGPRGVGKSTLLKSFYPSPSSDTLTILVSAPVEYDARDFLLHIFSTLCRQILASRDVSDEVLLRYANQAPAAGRLWQPDTLIPFEVRASIRLFGWFLCATGAMFVWFAIGDIPLFKATWFKQILTILAIQPGQLLLWGIILTALSYFPIRLRRIRPSYVVVREKRSTAKGLVSSFARFWTEPPVAPRQVRITPLESRLANELRDIRFQRSYTTGWSGALKMPVGIEFGATNTMSTATNPESLPELVERFRRFLEDILDRREGVEEGKRESYSRVIIAIDELDKLESASTATRFINELKAIFGIRNCFYLVSVSENALSNFERRGLPLRDAFDSAFDDIIFIDHLTLGDSRSLLNRRILNLPGPFLCLCHVLSGGLPRDLIRVARTMEITAREISVRDLQTIARRLLLVEAEMKLRATSIVLQEASAEADAAELLAVISSMEQNLRSTKQLNLIRDAVPAGPARGTQTSPVARVGRELVAYLDFLLLVQNAFDTMTTEKKWRTTRDLFVEELARARRAFEVGLGAAEFQLESIQIAMRAIAP